MMVVKILGILAVAWIVLGVAFIEPSKQLALGPHPGAAAPLTLAGVVLVGVPAYLLVRRVVKRSRREDTKQSPRV
jgi:hypothetical protein